MTECPRPSKVPQGDAPHQTDIPFPKHVDTSEMKRNMDLVQEILSEVRETDPFNEETEDLRVERLPGHWKIQKLSYHLVLLLEEGFLARGLPSKAKWTGEQESGSNVGLRLTWRGHDLLEELKDDNAIAF